MAAFYRKMVESRREDTLTSLNGKPSQHLRQRRMDWKPICGYYTDSVPVSAYSYACIEGAKQVLAAGQNAEITLKMGRWCSYPRWFMEKLAQRRDLTIHLQFEYLHKQYEVLIPAKTPMDTECEWYGPLKLCNLYPYTIK